MQILPLGLLVKCVFVELVIPESCEFKWRLSTNYLQCDHNTVEYFTDRLGKQCYASHFGVRGIVY